MSLFPPPLLLTKVGCPAALLFLFFPASDVDTALGLAAFREVMLAHVPTRPWMQSLMAPTQRCPSPPDGLSLSLPWRFVVGTGGCLTNSSARCLSSRCSPDGVAPLASPCLTATSAFPPPKSGLGCCQRPYSALR